MTLGVAWIRNVGDVEEVVVASDSLLSAGPETWTACPKILALPRTDAVVSFAGVTEFAYPALLQISRAIESHPAQVERRYDITYLAGLMENILNQLDSYARSDVSGSLQHSRKITKFLLLGYSWKYSRFFIWRYEWSLGVSRYVRTQCRDELGSEGKTTYRFIGNPEAAYKAVKRVREIKSQHTNKALDMEPFEVLVEIIKSGEFRDIGGAPQVAKVYRHLNSQVFGTEWSLNGQQVPTYAGRPLLDFEKSHVPLIDPDLPGEFGKNPRRARIE